MNKHILGVTASQGIVIGKAYIFEKTKYEISKNLIQDKDKDCEKTKIKEAIVDYMNELKHREFSSESQKSVAEAHIELIQDPYLIDTISVKIDSEGQNGELALKNTIDEMCLMMQALDDEYLRERASDYKDVGDQLMYKLKGIKPKTLSEVPQDVIVISEELTPSDTSTMDKDNIKGFVMDLGGKTSHVSIIAQTLAIPAIVGTKDATKKIKDGQLIILDGESQKVLLDPTDEQIKIYEEKINKINIEKDRLESIKFKEAITKDGHKVDVFCNIGGPQDLESGLEGGAEGVGLFRTEFLYMESDDFPDEETQYLAYKDVIEKLEGRSLILRTLDIGGDKGLKYFKFPEEENPFLGWRALRIGFDKPEILKTQLRAILRASAFGDIKILLPMIISVEELDFVNKVLEECKQELRKEDKSFNEKIDVGVMIETPASVMIAERLIERCDFFSIGTNDLTQYTLAVDRGNQVVSHLYNHFHPAVLASIKKVIDASHKAGKYTGMCGAMASDTKASYLLLGMGLDEFSSVGANIGKIKDIVINSDYKEASIFAKKVLSLPGVKDVEKFLEDELNEVQR